MDIIIVLGHDVNKDGTLPREARLRVRKGVEAFKGGRYSYMLMTGRYPVRKEYIPTKTEAAAMRDFASSLGVPKERILVEDRSRDTMGNAYFSRVLLGPRKLGRIAVVTSDYHVKKARFIFSKVYGKDCQMRFIGAKVIYPKPKMAKTRTVENYLLKLTKDFFKGVRDSDTKAVRHLLYTEHQVYSRNPRIGGAKRKELEKLERLRIMQYKA
jgi:uncharacterized SAM-binding protein YcdF (DUF218 family)